MREEVIIQSIRISKKKEQLFFQVKLPRDTKRIIGIETGLVIESVLPAFAPLIQTDAALMRQRRLIGCLQLRTFGKPDLFYATEIFERDINLGIGEVKLFPAPPKEKVLPDEPEPVKGEVPAIDSNNFSDHNIWTHGTKREEDPLSICGCTLINGQFKDAIGEYYNLPFVYNVILYIWIERKINEKQ